MVTIDSEYSRKAAKHVLSEVEGLAEVNLLLNRACSSLVKLARLIDDLILPCILEVI